MTRDEAHAEIERRLALREGMTGDDRRRNEDRVTYLLGFIDGLDAAAKAAQ